MTAPDGGDAVTPRLRAGDAAVPVVIVALKGIAGLPASRSGNGRHRLDRTTLLYRHCGRCAARQDALQHVALALIDGEGVSLTHLDYAAREPAVVQIGEPFRRAPAALLRTVHRRAGQRQVQQVGSEPPLRGGIRCAEAAVVGLGACGDVLDVGLGRGVV